MAADTRSRPEAFDGARALRLAMALVLVMTIVRLVALFATTLDLYPDEAQYWLWSRQLAFGYFSKPPLIAWIIAATTGVGGDAEPWVRMGAPLCQAGAALALFFTGRRLFGPVEALLGCALYMLAPAVQLSSAVIATDAPLMLCASLALLAFVSFQAAPRGAPSRLALAAAFGAALGFAFLAKYAAIYVLIGFGLHLATSREARRAWDLPSALLAGALLAAVLAPNLIWNANHQFHTFEHTVANGNWRAGQMFKVGELADFIGSQFGVFGPVAFGTLLFGVGLIAARRLRPSQGEQLLLCLAAPTILAVTVQAFLSRANANWASVAYVAAALLVAVWLVRWRAKGWIIAALATQSLLAIIFLACVVSPRFTDAIGLSDGFKRAKGWEAITQAVVARAQLENANTPLTAVAVDDRFLFNSLAYYGRDYFAQPGAPPLKMWLHEARAQSQAEAEAPLTTAEGGRVLGAALEGGYRDEFKADFAKVDGVEIVRVSLDRKRNRRTDLFIGQTLRPLPRDPVTGEPPDQHTKW